MKTYELYTINYMRDLNYKTNNYEDMRKRVEEIKELVKGNRKSEVFFEGAYIVVMQDGKEIDSITWNKF